MGAGHKEMLSVEGSFEVVYRWIASKHFDFIAPEGANSTKAATKMQERYPSEIWRKDFLIKKSKKSIASLN